MKDLKEQILKEYQTSVITRQTYQAIADKVGCTKSYVWQVIKASNPLSVPPTEFVDTSKEGNEGNL